MRARARCGLRTKPVAPGQLAFELAHEPSLAETDYLESEGNRMALAHLRAWPAWTSPLCLIIGPARSGKSHLARIWAERADARVAEPHAIEDLAREGGSGPLVAEDIDRSRFDETALFHLLNQSLRDVRPLLMTARLPVVMWPLRTDDVRSRIRLAAAFTIGGQDDTQLTQIFAKLFSDRQIAVDPKTLAFLVARMERSPAEAEALVDLMDRMALSRGTAITRALASEALAERRAQRGGERLSEWEGDGDE